MSSRIVFLCYIGFKRGARCVLMRVEKGSLVQSRVQLFLFNKWFMLERALSSDGARGKFGEHERNVRVARVTFCQNLLHFTLGQ